jgi:hypothetical protein
MASVSYLGVEYHDIGFLEGAPLIKTSDALSKDLLPRKAICWMDLKRSEIPPMSDLL